MAAEAPHTYNFSPENPFEKKVAKSYICTYDGVKQIVVSNHVAAIIDAGTIYKDYNRLYDDGSTPVVYQFPNPGDDEPRAKLKKSDKHEKSAGVLGEEMFQTVLEDELQACLKEVTEVRVCIVSHVHVDHINKLLVLLEGKKIISFILGGSPTDYLTAGDELLTFIVNMQEKPKVYFTELRKNFEEFFSTRETIIGELKKYNFYELHDKTDIHVGRREVINEDTADIPYAPYLTFEDVSLSLYSVNPATGTFDPETETSAPRVQTMIGNADSQCMIVVAAVKGTNLGFLGDSTVVTQKLAQNKITPPFRENTKFRKRVEILVLSKNSSHGVHIQDSDRTKHSNTSESIAAWSPDVYLLPISSNNSQPKLPLIGDICTHIQQSANTTELEEHEIVFFAGPAELFQEKAAKKRRPVESTNSDTDNHTDKDGAVALKPTDVGAGEGSSMHKSDDLDLEGTAPVRTGRRKSLRGQQSPKYAADTEVEPSAFFKNKLAAMGIKYKSFSKVDVLQMYRVFAETELPIITLHRPLSLIFNQRHVCLYQPPGLN